MKRPAADPVLHSARREAWFALALWCTAAAWTIGYCAWAGYDRSAASLRFVCGFPDWVFWGIVVPWAICLAIGIWFPFGFMTDEELGAEEPELPMPGSGAGRAIPSGWGDLRSDITAGSETRAERANGTAASETRAERGERDERGPASMGSGTEDTGDA